VKVVALSGGVGGARLVDGLARVLPPGALSVVVNTGDDFVHWGLPISPDLDTVMYTLAGLAHEARGWGLAGETFHAVAMMARLGGEAWFQLGDRDLATHLRRAEGLRSGRTLTQVTAALTAALGLTTPLLPMSDEPCPTRLETDEGTLDFQDWLVRRRGAPTVRRVLLGQARPTAEVLAALDAADVVVLGPSNPYVSIDPILALPGVRARLARRPLVAVSPIVGGRAVKGPLAEMIPSLSGEPPSAAAIARHYGPLLTGLVVERGDEPAAGGPRLHATRTVMSAIEDRRRLAAEVLSFAEGLL
jgi:LPPG:FO 2-phospho-L-lactate transferase